MKRINASMGLVTGIAALFGLFFLSVAATCGQTLTPVTTTTTSTTSDWSIGLSSEGGIAGRGVGGVVVSAAGLEASDLRGSCHASISAGAREALRGAVEASHPASWKSMYADPAAPNGHPDQILYRLSYRESATSPARNTSWYGEDLKWTPQSIASLYRRLQGLRTEALAHCR